MSMIQQLPSWLFPPSQKQAFHGFHLAAYLCSVVFSVHRARFPLIALFPVLKHSIFYHYCSHSDFFFFLAAKMYKTMCHSLCK